jgi:hypothetical protein
MKYVHPGVLCRKILKQVHNNQPRQTTEYAKRHFKGKPLIATEIGVAAGENSESIMKTLNVKMLFLVDPYTPYTDLRSVEEQEQAKMLASVKRRVLDQFPRRTRLLRMTSDQAAEYLPCEQDFIYIDGLHDYDHVAQDMANFFPKVRRDGILAGHDYCFPYDGLQKAVSEFCATHNVRLHILGGEWLIVKEPIQAGR